MASLDASASSTGAPSTPISASVGTVPLTQVPLLANVPADLLATLNPACSHEHWAAGATIVRNGDASDRIYFLLAGATDIVNEFNMVVERIRHVAGESVFFGEVGILENVPRTASVQTSMACETLSLSQEHFRMIMDRCPDIAAQMTQTAKARLQGFLMRNVLA